jgi:hypothetical protein
MATVDKYCSIWREFDVRDLLLSLLIDFLDLHASIEDPHGSVLHPHDELLSVGADSNGSGFALITQVSSSMV